LRKGLFSLSSDDCVITRLCKLVDLFDDVLITAGKYRIDESTPFASFCRILEGYKAMTRLRGLLKDFLVLKKSVLKVEVFIEFLRGGVKNKLRTGGFLRHSKAIKRSV
jgi:hypothetical protein